MVVNLLGQAQLYPNLSNPMFDGCGNMWGGVQFAMHFAYHHATML